MTTPRSSSPNTERRTGRRAGKVDTRLIKRKVVDRVIVAYGMERLPIEEAADLLVRLSRKWGALVVDTLLDHLASEDPHMRALISNLLDVLPEEPVIVDALGRAVADRRRPIFPRTLALHRLEAWGHVKADLRLRHADLNVSIQEITLRELAAQIADPAFNLTYRNAYLLGSSLTRREYMGVFSMVALWGDALAAELLAWAAGISRPVRPDVAAMVPPPILTPSVAGPGAWRHNRAEAERFLEEARAAHRAKRPAEVAFLLYRALLRNPRHPAARLFLAESLLDMHCPELCLAALSDLRVDRPGSHPLYHANLLRQRAFARYEAAKNRAMKAKPGRGRWPIPASRSYDDPVRKAIREADRGGGHFWTVVYANSIWNLFLVMPPVLPASMEEELVAEAGERLGGKPGPLARTWGYACFSLALRLRTGQRPLPEWAAARFRRARCCPETIAGVADRIHGLLEPPGATPWLRRWLGMPAVEAP